MVARYPVVSVLGICVVVAAQAACSPSTSAADDPAVVRGIEQRVARQETDVEMCWQQARAAGANVDGTWTVSWTVTVQGVPDGLGITAPAGMIAPDMHKCLADRVSMWTFDAVPSPTKFSKSWTFPPPSAPAGAQSP